MNSSVILSNCKHRLDTAMTLATLCIISIMLAGCSHTVQRETCVALAKDVSYCLAPIPLDGVEDNWTRSVTQKAEIKVDTSRHELMTQLEIDPSNMTLVGLAPLGQALFTLIYDGQNLTSEQSILLGSEFKAEYLLAMIQLIYWPEETVNAHLRGAKIISIDCAAPSCRTIYANYDASLNVLSNRRHDDTVLNIEYSHKNKWQAEIKLDIPQANFELKITPI